MKLILLIVAAIMIYCIAAICMKSNDYSVSHIKKVITAKRKLKLWTLLGGVICALILVYSSYYQSASGGSGIITLNYSEASKAQNSNKTRFNMGEILSDEVIDRAIQKGGMKGVTREGLRKALVVNPVVQGDSHDRDSYHISTEFRVVYKANKETRKLEPTTVIQLVAESFKEVYIRKYAKNFGVLRFRAEEAKQFKDWDYYDIAYYLSMRADNITSYMSELNGESPSFKSKKGMSFSSLAAKSGNIRTELLDNDLLAYIRDRGISKNKTEMLKRLSYNNNMMRFDMRKANSSFNINNQAVEMYAAEMTRIALVPTIDSNKDYYMSKTKVGLDDLSLAAKTASDQAKELLLKIKKNSEFADSLRASSSAFGTNPVVDEEIDEVVQSLVNISRDAKNTAQEYTESRMNEVISVQINYPSMLRTAAKCLILTLLFFGALYVLSVTRDYTEGRLGE